jgi:hypothetical protein
MLKRMADAVEVAGKDHCRVQAVKFPLAEARYSVFGELGGAVFQGSGKLREAERVMLRHKVPRLFYDTLVEVCIKVGEQNRLEPDFSVTQMRCIGSLSLWKQSIPVVAAVTGVPLEAARAAMHSLYSEGYIEMAQRGGETRFALTVKGETALMFLADRPDFKRIQKQELEAASSIDWSAWKGGRPGIPG